MKKIILSGLLLLFLFAVFAVSAFPATINASLSWTDNSANEDGFKVERCTGAGCSTFAQIGTTLTNAAAYTDANLAPGTTYCYRVRAYNTAGDSGYTNTACLTTPTPPAAPGSLTVVVTMTP